MPPRDHALDALKGVAIVGVLFCHVPADRFDSAPAIKAVARLLQWCVPAFFFAAGLLAPRVEGLNGCWRAIRRRAVRLLLPFVAFTALYKSLLLLSVLIRHKGEWHWASYGGAQLYFLPYLFVVSSAVNVMLATVLTTPGRIVTVMGLTALVTLLLRPPFPTHGAHLELAGLYTANYLAGVCFGVGLRAAPAVVLLCSSIGVAWWCGNWNLAAAAVPPFVYRGLDSCPRTSVTNAVQWLGRWSSAVFVWHTPFLLPVFGLISVHLLGGGFVALALTIGLTIAGSTALGWLMGTWWVFRPLRA